MRQEGEGRNRQDFQECLTSGFHEHKITPDLAGFSDPYNISTFSTATPDNPSLLRSNNTEANLPPYYWLASALPAAVLS